MQAFDIAQRNPHVREMLQYLFVYPGKRYAFFDTSIADRNAKPTLGVQEARAVGREGRKSWAHSRSRKVAAAAQRGLPLAG